MDRRINAEFANKMARELHYQILEEQLQETFQEIEQRAANGYTSLVKVVRFPEKVVKSLRDYGFEATSQAGYDKDNGKIFILWENVHT